MQFAHPVGVIAAPS